MPNRLRTLRERKGISQVDLSRLVDVSRQAVSAVEMNKQEPSLPLALKISKVLDTPLQHIFFLEDADVETTKSVSLTKLERLNLVNQYRLLQGVHRDDEYLVKYYHRMEEIFERGYEQLYHEALDQLWDALPRETSEEVLSILEMHRALRFSLGDKPDPRDIERVKFEGFDANNESQHLGFAKFFVQDGEKYRELMIFNSHYPTLPRYRKMLAEWQRMGRQPRLSRAQIDSILEAGTFED